MQDLHKSSHRNQNAHTERRPCYPTERRIVEPRKRLPNILALTLVRVVLVVVNMAAETQLWEPQLGSGELEKGDHFGRPNPHASVGLMVCGGGEVLSVAVHNAGH
jgi:hypothetical protein